MITVLWMFTLLNVGAFAITMFSYLDSANGRRVDYQEKGWMTILFCAGAVIILLGVLPLAFSNGVFGRVIASFFTLLPTIIALSIFVSKKLRQRKQNRRATY